MGVMQDSTNQSSKILARFIAGLLVIAFLTLKMLDQTSWGATAFVFLGVLALGLDLRLTHLNTRLTRLEEKQRKADMLEKAANLSDVMRDAQSINAPTRPNQ